MSPWPTCARKKTNPWAWALVRVQAGVRLDQLPARGAARHQRQGVGCVPRLRGERGSSDDGERRQEPAAGGASRENIPGTDRSSKRRRAPRRGAPRAHARRLRRGAARGGGPRRRGRRPASYTAAEVFTVEVWGAQAPDTVVTFPATRARDDRAPARPPRQHRLRRARVPGGCVGTTAAGGTGHHHASGRCRASTG